MGDGRWSMDVLHSSPARWCLPFADLRPRPTNPVGLHSSLALVDAITLISQPSPKDSN